MSASLTFIHGTFVHCLSNTEIEYVENGLLGFDHAGVIRVVERDVSTESALEDILTRNGCGMANLTRLTKHQFVMPGFIDTHTVRVCFFFVFCFFFCPFYMDG